jgi:site-specific DNA-methyltransferase (adenine-specific)
MTDHHLKRIKHFEDAREVFKEVNIAGGIQYFLWDQEYNGNTIINDNEMDLSKDDIILTEPIEISIIDKVKKKSQTFISEVCLSRKPFGLPTNFLDWDEEGKHICYSQNRTKNRILREKFLDKASILDKWKVVTSKATSEGNRKEDNTGRVSVISNVFVIKPSEICLETYLVVNYFNSELEATNFLGYTKTKFFRFMLSLMVCSQDINKAKFSLVPNLLDYTREYADEELYQMFGLTEEEISYIESKIKEL